MRKGGQKQKIWLLDQKEKRLRGTQAVKTYAQRSLLNTSTLLSEDSDRPLKKTDFKEIALGARGASQYKKTHKILAKTSS